MSSAWTFEHTIAVRASRDAAWAFWSDVANWAAIDPAVEWARLDGPFVAGTRGETKPVGAPSNAWRLVEVAAPTHAVIEIPIPGAAVRFTWTFADDGAGGATLTQLVDLSGERAEQYLDSMPPLAAGIPPGMRKLADTIERSTGGSPD